MAIQVNELPIVTITAHAIILYPDKTGYAVKHTYCADMNGEMDLLKNTLINILEQRFPHMLMINFVSPNVYEKIIKDGTLKDYTITEKDDVELPNTILFKTNP